MVADGNRGTRTTTSPRADISSNIGTGERATSINANTSRTARIASGLNIVAGLWLIIAPWLLGYGQVPAPMWNDIIVGVVVFCLAVVRFVKPQQYAAISWLNVALGVWLIVAPFALPYGGGTALSAGVPFWNDIILGAVIVVLALLSADSTNNAVQR